MHIGFQRSGGRGEYEVVGTHSGYNAIGLEGWSFYLRWPDGLVRDTGLELEPATSGKPRLRSLWSPPFQIGRCIAAMLMLPDPRREYAQTLTGSPVARGKGYVLSRIGFGPDTEFSGVADRVTIDPTFVDLDNLSDKFTIGISHRWRRIQAVYDAMDRLPDGVRLRLKEHRNYLAGGDPITAQLTGIVLALEKIVEPEMTRWTWLSDSDVLPALEALLGIGSVNGPTLPPPDALGEDEPIVSARSAHEYRLAKTRGASGRHFAKQVNAAYNSRCLFCGGVFGGVPSIRSGVDAAHILAWSKFDLDVVPNGISLCKLHHWAFDAALLVPFYQDKKYVLQFTELSKQFDALTLEKLGVNDFEIPRGWLPADSSMWPSQRYLDRLYADLAISFSD